MTLSLPVRLVQYLADRQEKVYFTLRTIPEVQGLIC